MEADLLMKMLLYCIIILWKYLTAESYLEPPDWMANKGATINPKNKKDNKYFQYSIIPGLNYNKILKKCLKK